MARRSESSDADEATGSEATAPERRQAAVRRSGDLIFVDADGRSEKARHEIGAAAGRAAGHDDSARANRSQAVEIRVQHADRFFVLELHDVIELTAPDVLWRGAQ